MEKPDTLSWQLDHRNKLWDNENIILLKLELLAICVLEGIAFKDEKKGLLTDIWWGNRLGHHKEPVAKAVRKLQQSSAKLMHSLEWSKIDSLFLFHSKIYISDMYNPHQCIISLHHNIKVTSHTGY